MLTYEDVIGLCELTEEEIRAIAEHEHLPEIVAAEMGTYLATSEAGVPFVKRILLDDMRAAERRGDHREAPQIQGDPQALHRRPPEDAAPKG